MQWPAKYMAESYLEGDLPDDIVIMHLLGTVGIGLL